MKKLKTGRSWQIMCLLLTALLLSCESRTEHDIVLNEDTRLIDSFPEEEEIKFIDVFEYNKGEPRTFHVLDSVLIIANKSRSADHIFYKYSLMNNKLSNGFLEKGRGPGEFIGIHTNGIHDNTLWAWDVTLKKVLKTNINNVLKENDTTVFNEYPVKDLYIKMVFLDSLRVLATNINDESPYKLETLNIASGKKINEFAKFHKIPEDLPVGSAKDAYTAEIFRKPSGEKIALAYNNADVLEIYDLETGSSFAVKGPAAFNSRFTVEKNKDFYYSGSARETRKAFNNGAVTEDYIYLLYSGHQRENRSEEDRYKWNHARYVYVYDWNGKPVKKITLDTYINSFGISQDGKIIYSFNDKTGYIIKANIKS